MLLLLDLDSALFIDKIDVTIADITSLGLYYMYVALLLCVMFHIDRRVLNRELFGR